MNDAAKPVSAVSPAIGIVMGSHSDYETLKYAECILIDFSVPYEIQVVSAHRTPEVLYEYAKTAQARGLQAIVAGAGGAAHLPGMISALTLVPVLAVPVQSRALGGVDSLLSIVQMPAGVPTATFAIGVAGATNAALFAVQMLALSNRQLASALVRWREQKASQALVQGNEVVQALWRRQNIHDQQENT